MAEPTITVRRNLSRPDPSQLEPFGDMPACRVVDATGRRGALDTAIRPLTSPHVHRVG